MKRKLIQMIIVISFSAMIVTGCGAVTAGVESNVESVETTENVEADTEESATLEEESAVEESIESTESTQESAVESKEEVVAESEPAVSQGDIESEETKETAEFGENVIETNPAPTYTYTDLSRTMYAKSAVNVRDLPSTDGNKLGGLSTNQEVEVTGQCNETGWYRIHYNETVAYVSNSYIVNEPVVVQAPEAGATQSYPDSSSHSYYKNISAEQAAEADAVAKQIADSIMSNSAYTTDLERVNAAAQIVAGYCSQCSYGSDAAKWYRSPYGVFVAGVYTCAGSTRALGRVLDFMGYSWQHVNENQNTHQWCVLTMDGQTGFADGMGGFAGYGEMTSGMTLPDGSMIFF